MKIHAAKFGVAFGIVYALIFFLYGAVAALFGWGAEFATMIGDFYFGFGPTLAGALIGTVWEVGTDSASPSGWLALEESTSTLASPFIASVFQNHPQE